MEIPDGLDVVTSEMLLQGIPVKIERMTDLPSDDPFPGYHKRQTYCIVDGVLCRVTTATGKKDKFGN